MLEAELREIDGSQCVVLPDDLRLPGKVVQIETIGDKLLLAPSTRPTLRRRQSRADFDAFWAEIDRLMGARLNAAGEEDEAPKPAATPADVEAMYARIDALLEGLEPIPYFVDEPAPEPLKWEP